MRIPLIGGSASSYALSAAAQQSINIYRETIEGASGKTVVENASEKNTAVLRGIPGIHLFKDLTAIDAAATPVRGMFSGGGRLFVAAGNKQFEVSSSGTLVGSVATIANDGNPADILANGNQLFVVSGGLTYCNNGSGLVQNTLPGLSGTVVVVNGSPAVFRFLGDSFDIGLLNQTITIGGVGYTVGAIINPDFLTLTANYAGASGNAAWSATPVMNASRGAFMDGYFIISRPSSRQFNISKNLNGSTWSQLDSQLKEGYTDNLLAVYTEPPLLYLLGSESLEVWRDTGASPFPFERVDGGFARIGLASTWSPTSVNGKLHMLAGGSYGQTIAVRMEGATPVRISTHAQEESWNSGLAMQAEGVSYSYIDRGHWFWVINFLGVFGGSNYTWVYDATESALTGTPQWHQRAHWDGAAWQQYTPWYHTFIPEWGAKGKHIVGDQASGKLYEMSSDFFDDAGSDIRCVRAMTHLYGGGARQYMSRFEVEMETGTSWNAGANTPAMTLDWSNDRGHTFAGGPRTLSTGASNAYTQRVYANQIGSYRDRVMRLTVQGQAKVALIDVNAEIHSGNL